MQEIIQFAADVGLNITEVIPDGKPHKFKVAPNDDKKSGWYICYQNHTVTTGELFYIAVIGNYRTGETWTYKNDVVKLKREDKKNVKAQIDAAKKKHEEELLKVHSATALEAEIKWNGLSGSGISDYLSAKRISVQDEDTRYHEGKPLGIRFDSSGAFFVPMRDTQGKLWSLQKILSGFKQYMSGGKKQGCFHLLGSAEDNDTIRMVEGFATGASVFLACGGCVVVTFDSGNLVVVAKLLKEKYPDKNFIICGDDDRHKEKNAGRTKGEEAAKITLGKSVYPTFTDSTDTGTDFNDLHIEEGLDVVKAQIEEVVAPKLALYTLGYKEKEYFFTSTSNRQIVSVTAFTETDFLNLMPVEYWEAIYPSRGENTRCDYSSAKSQLMQSCRNRGIFNGFNVRGAGVWMDDSRIVVNMGDHLVVDGQRMGLGDIKSRFFYSLGTNLSNLHTQPLTVEECKPLVNACSNFKWKNQDAGILLAGALVLTRVCGAIPIRPHLWITGGAETGKTTLLEKLINVIIGVNALYVSRGTTEAGVRQSLKSNSIPVLFDEFETSNTAGDASIDALIELMRGAWSDSSAKILKGGSNGNATEYVARFSAIVSSIRTKLNDQADKGRFTVLELAPHGADAEHWKQLKGYLTQINGEFAERLFSRTIAMLPVILENQKVMQEVFAKKGGSRFGDQYGMILAGYASLIFDDVISREDAEWLAGEVTLEEEKEVVKGADHADCLGHLWTTMFSYEGVGGIRVSEPVGRTIDTLQKEITKSEQDADQNKKKALLSIGIRVYTDSIAIVSSGHAALQKAVFQGTKWSQNWGVSLKRHNGAEKKKIRIDGKSLNCIVIPNTSIFDS